MSAQRVVPRPDTRLTPAMSAAPAWDLALATVDPDTEVIVLGIWLHGAAMMRRLAARGWRVVGVTDDLRDGARASRYCFTGLCPNPNLDADGWLEFMNALGARCTRRPLLLPTLDRFVLALDRHADKLSGSFRLHGFGSNLRTRLTSKEQSYALADKSGFPVVKAQPIDNVDALAEFCHGATWPVLLKPDLTFEWHRPEIAKQIGDAKVLRGDSVETLCAAYQDIATYCPRMIAQEVIVGPDENLIYWAGFVDADHRVRGRIVGRKLRTMPPGYGSATFVTLIDMPEVEATCARFVRRIGYQGLCGIELKIDTRDGIAKLIEVNSRFGQWDELGAPYGVDLAHEAAAAAFDRPYPDAARPSRFGGQWVHLGLDLAALRRYRAMGRLTMWRWLRSFGWRLTVTDQPWRSDPGYAWAQLRRIGAAALRVATGRSIRTS